MDNLERVHNLEAIYPVLRGARVSRILAKYLLYAAEAFGYDIAVFGLALRLLSDYSAYGTVTNMQLYTLACLSIAAQMNDESSDVDSLIYLSNEKYTAEQLSLAVVEVITLLGGKLRPPTAIDVLSGEAKELCALAYAADPNLLRVPVGQMAELCLHLQTRREITPQGVYVLRSIEHLLARYPEVQDGFSVIARVAPAADGTGRLEIPVGTIPPLVTERSRNDTVPIGYWIAKGAYGQVSAALKGDVVSAIKVQLVTESALAELSVLATCRHPNIIGLRSFSLGAELELEIELGVPLSVIVSPEGSTDTYWEEVYIRCDQRAVEVLPHSIRRKYGRHLVSGLKYLNSIGIIHLDIKPDNIIVVNGVAKYADFGIAAQCNLEVKKRSVLVVTLWFRPPELLWGQGHDYKEYSYEVDCWSLGCVLAYIETGVIPFTSRYPVSKSDRRRVESEVGVQLAMSCGGHNAADGCILDIMKRIEELVGIPAIDNYSTYERSASIIPNDLKCLSSSGDIHPVILGLLDPNPRTRLGIWDVSF